VLKYFQALLKQGKLNSIESVEIVKPVLAKRSPAGLEHIKEWLKEQKLECSAELGDTLMPFNVTLALSVYLRAKVPDKVISCFMALAAQESDDGKATEHLNNIFAYAKRVAHTPDFATMLPQLAAQNGDRAKDLALILLSGTHGSEFQLDITLVLTPFLQTNDVKNATNILLEYLKSRGDREEDAALQTKLLEINLMAMPQVADAILESDDYQLSHYDKPKIAALCERAQLYTRALEHYTDLEDIKRVLTQTHLINPDFLIEFMGRMTPDNCLECMRAILKYNLQQNIRLVVEIAKKWSEYVSPPKLIALFEEFESHNGLFFYVGSFVNTSEDTEVVYKYVEAAVQLNQLKEAERICRDHDHYDPLQMKAFLLTAGLKDPRPLIHVCDRHNFVNELTQHLYSNNSR
jgi:clathrin heavy chain